jgi:hypothetical protein
LFVLNDLAGILITDLRLEICGPLADAGAGLGASEETHFG